MWQQERPVHKLAYGEMQCAITLEILSAILEFEIGEMQCAITLEILSAILEFVIGFVSNF